MNVKNTLLIILKLFIYFYSCIANYMISAIEVGRKSLGISLGILFSLEENYWKDKERRI